MCKRNTQFVCHPKRRLPDVRGVSQSLHINNRDSVSNQTIYRAKSLALCLSL
jgi:hypothetical protein